MQKNSKYNGSCAYKSKSAAVAMSFLILFSILSSVYALTSEEEGDPLEGGDSEPLSTLDFRSLKRYEDPVIVTADLVPDLIGTPVNNADVLLSDNDILVYAWIGATSSWSQIPFQVDERNLTTGSYGVNNANGILDGIDEIVFMSKDAGDEASENEWVVGCSAPRYVVELVDPATFECAWAYIYKSSLIEAEFTQDYVHFDAGVNDVFTDSYTMGFRNGVGMVVDYFNITADKGGDGQDIIDTLEMETIARLGIFTLTYDENDMGSDFTLKKDGYVRALGVVSWHIYKEVMGIVVDSYFNFTWKFYPEYVNSTGYMDITIVGDVEVDIWIAVDHTNKSIPMDYLDSHGNTGVINGIDDDSILGTITQGWWEVSSPHGGYVCVWNIDLIREQDRLMFEDDLNAADHANAEPGLYGRTGGHSVNISHNQLSYANISFLPIASNVSGVGGDISYNVTHPLNLIITASHSPTIWVEKGTSSAFAGEGDYVDYTIYFNNTGDLNAQVVWINDTLPSDVTFFDHDAGSLPYFTGFNQILGTLCFEFSNVPPGEHCFNITVTVNLGVTPGQDITNWVFCNFTNQIMQSMPESWAGASFEVTGSGAPLVIVEKRVDKKTASSGETLQYTIYFNNSGTQAAGTIWINDSLPSEVTYISDSSATEFGIKTGDYNWTFTNVVPGSHYFVINVSLGSGEGGTLVANLVFLEYTSAGGAFLPGSFSWANMTLVTEMVLKQGWNLISIPHIQVDSDLLDVLSSIFGLYDAVQWYDVEDGVDYWKHNKDGKLFGNDLFRINETMGFWVHITPPGDTVFSYNGIPPVVNQNIALSSGWNLVGYPSLTEYNRTNGLNNIEFGVDVDCIQWFDASAKTWHFLGSGDDFVPGRGYWMHSKADFSWEVPL